MKPPTLFQPPPTTVWEPSPSINSSTWLTNRSVIITLFKCVLYHTILAVIAVVVDFTNTCRSILAHATGIENFKSLFFFFLFPKGKMKPAGGYYLLYLTRPTDKRDRPTGYLFNHFFSLSYVECVCVCRASLCLARSSGEAEKVTTRTNKTKRNARFLYLYFYSSFLFFLSWKIMEIQNKNTENGFFPFLFSMYVFFSVCPAAGCRWRGHQIHTRTGQRETHQTDSLIMLSAARAPALPYIHTRQQTWGSPISFRLFELCV